MIDKALITKHDEEDEYSKLFNEMLHSKLKPGLNGAITLSSSMSREERRNLILGYEHANLESCK